MSFAEEQAVELEVLESIFAGDSRFTKIASNSFQYKLGDDGHFKSFLLGISWPASYPSTAPTIELDAFYNKHLSSEVKTAIKEALNAEAETMLGMAATFSLIEFAKENFEHLTAQQTERTFSAPDARERATSEDSDGSDDAGAGRGKQKKPAQLTKAQKRRMWDKTEAGKFGERERGWDWVDVIKHLSQTGGSSS